MNLAMRNSMKARANAQKPAEKQAVKEKKKQVVESKEELNISNIEKELEAGIQEDQIMVDSED